MGSRLVSFSFTPGENEQIETVIKLPQEHRSIIHGVVKNHCNKVVKDAVVKLFEFVIQDDEPSLIPLTHTFTDEYGQFLFGPLAACREYVIKVWVNDVKIRELVIRPEEYECPEISQNYKKPLKTCENKIEPEEKINMQSTQADITEEIDE
jgi:hypothetical protein